MVLVLCLLYGLRLFAGCLFGVSDCLICSDWCLLFVSCYFVVCAGFGGGLLLVRCCVVFDDLLIYLGLFVCYCELLPGWLCWLIVLLI